MEQEPIESLRSPPVWVCSGGDDGTEFDDRVLRAGEVGVSPICDCRPDRYCCPSLKPPACGVIADLPLRSLPEHAGCHVRADGGGV